MQKGDGAENTQCPADEAFPEGIVPAKEIAEAVPFLLSEHSCFTMCRTYVADSGRVALP